MTGAGILALSYLVRSVVRGTRRDLRNADGFDIERSRIRLDPLLLFIGHDLAHAYETKSRMLDLDHGKSRTLLAKDRRHVESIFSIFAQENSPFSHASTVTR